MRGQHGLAVLEGAELAGQEVAHPPGVLEVERVVQVERLADLHDVLGLEPRVHRVDRARLPRREVHDGVGEDRDHDEEPEALGERAREEAPHGYAPPAENWGTRSSFRQWLNQ